MFMGLTPEVWAQLWNGIFGAIIAGCSAAAVAMVVLRKTNEHQSQLTDTQLAEQRQALDKQLDEQRTGLERQLHAQRNQAEHNRRNEALAELVDALSLIILTGNPKRQSVIAMGMRARTATFAWEVSNGDAATAQTLRRLIDFAAQMQRRPPNENYLVNLESIRETQHLKMEIHMMIRIIVELARADGTSAEEKASTDLKSLLKFLESKPETNSPEP